MDKLPNCKLCGATPIEIQTFVCMKHMCPSKNCTLNHVLLRPEQWIALMGDGMDAVRIDWIARHTDFEHSIVVDRPHDGEYEVQTGRIIAYGKTFREAIDAAMKEQGNG